MLCNLFIEDPSISLSKALPVQNSDIRSTPTSQSPSCYMGDRNATESWGPKRKRSEKRHSYFQSNLMKEFNSPKVMNQLFQVKDKRVSRSLKLKNHLIDGPDKYFNINNRVVVAASSLAKDAVILSNYDYKTLKIDQPIALGCVQFLVELFSKKREDIQIIYFSTPQLISENLIKKDNVLAIIHESAQYSLLIINMKKKKFPS